MVSSGSRATCFSSKVDSCGSYPRSGGGARSVRRPKMPDDPRFREKVTLRDADRPNRDVLGIEPGERRPGSRPLGPILKELAAQTGIAVLAECEDRSKEDRNYQRG